MATFANPDPSSEDISDKDEISGVTKFGEMIGVLAMLALLFAVILLL